MQRQDLSSQAYVIFQVGENELALPLFKVRQILSAVDGQWSAETQLGKVQYRGRAVDVLDLGARLGLAERSARQQAIILLNEATALRGLLVDSAPAVATIEFRQIRPLPALVRSPGDPYAGVAKLGENRLVLMLYTDKI